MWRMERVEDRRPSTRAGDEQAPNDWSISRANHEEDFDHQNQDVEMALTDRHEDADMQVWEDEANRMYAFVTFYFWLDLATLAAQPNSPLHMGQSVPLVMAMCHYHSGELRLLDTPNKRADAEFWITIIVASIGLDFIHLMLIIQATFWTALALGIADVALSICLVRTIQNDLDDNAYDASTSDTIATQSDTDSSM